MKLTLKIIFILLTTLTLNLRLNAQDPIIDSLKTALKNAKHDTTRCNILNELIDSENDDKVWPVYNEQLLKLAENGASKASRETTLKTFYLKHLASALNNVGYLAQNQGDVPKALEYYLKSLKIEEQIKNKKGIGYSLNNIGSVYKDQGDITKGLEYFHMALKIREETLKQSTNPEEIRELKKGIATSLNNIGIIHKNQGDAQKGLEYYHKSLKIQEEIKDKYGIAASLNNIGFIYDNHGDPSCHSSKEVCFRASQDKALEYYFKSLKIREEIKDKMGIATALNNIGGIYLNRAKAEQGSNSEEIKKALKYFQNSLKIQEEIKDKSGIASSLINIGNILLKQGKVMEALALANRSLQTSKELGYPKNIMSAASALKKIYQKQNNFKEALEMYELEIQMRDSINNEETKKASVKKLFQYQYEKQAAADSVKNAEEQKVKNAQLTAQHAQLKQEKTQRFALYGGLVLVVAFLGFIYNRFRITQKQKGIIEQQKVLVDEAFAHLEEKNKEVMDSIRYAKRIQTALLPNEKYIERKLNELI